MNLLKNHTLNQLTVFIFSFLIFTSALTAQISWGNSRDIALPSFRNNFPRIVTNGSGHPVVLWGNAANAVFSRWTGTIFTIPVQINQAGVSVVEYNWMGPEIASKGDTIYVVFKQAPEFSSSSNIYCARSFDGGVSFSTPIQVQNIGSDLSSFPVVTIDKLGNPIVGFMRYNSSMGNARWVISKSTDLGSTFLPDVLASGWSSPSSEACDCCPASIVSSDSIVALIYRDNNSNIRDSWVGISTNEGVSFSGGMDVDQQNWITNSCPSTGADVAIIGDTLYSTFMSAASGVPTVFFNKSSISNMAGSPSNTLTSSPFGLTGQNYPRIANEGNAVAIVWKQSYSGGASQIPILFSEDITSGQAFTSDTVDLNDNTNTDIVLNAGKVYVVWQDDNSGTVKFRSGTYASTLSFSQPLPIDNLTASPNPAEGAWLLTGKYQGSELKMELFDLQGKLLQSRIIKNQGDLNYKVENKNLSAGTYFIRLSGKKKHISLKVVKQ